MENDSDFFSFMTLAKELITDNRQIRLRLDLPGGVSDYMLLPQNVFGSEAICGGIVIEASSGDSGLTSYQPARLLSPAANHIRSWRSPTLAEPVRRYRADA